MINLRPDIKAHQLRCSTLGQSPVVAFAYDSDSQALYGVSGVGGVLCQNITGPGESWCCLDTGDTDAPELDSEVVLAAYVLELEALMLVFSTGQLICLNTDSHAPEEVGRVEHGIAAAAWSQEGTLALLTQTGHLLLLSQDWAVIHETFHFGNLDKVIPARQLAVETMPEVFHLTHSETALTWRADGKLLATISSAQAGSPAVLRIWTRDGELHSIGEKTDGLQPVMAWQPNGRHLYAAQSLSEGAQRVVLFENNGLQHGGFEVCPSGRIARMSWSADSQLLAVLLAPAAESAASCSVQLWSRRNWHWYLKHEQQWQQPASSMRLHWDEEAPSCLRTCTGTGLVVTASYAQEACISSRGSAVVIDGRKILLTPLRHSVVPPPLCSVTADLPAAACAAAFRDSSSASEALAALLSDGSLAIIESVQADYWEETLETTATGSDGDTTALMPGIVTLPELRRQFVQAMVWIAERILLLIGSAPPESEDDEQEDTLTEVHLSWDAPSCCHLSVDHCSEQPAPGRVLSATAGPEGGAFLQLHSGALWQYGAGSTMQPCKQLSSLSAPCPQIWAVPQEVAAAGGSPLVGRSAAGQLFWGSELVAEHTTSAAIRDRGPGGPHLLWTTRSNFLYCRLFASLGDSQSKEALLRTRLPASGLNTDMHLDMRAAMRGHGSAASAPQTAAARAVEQGALLVAAPRGSTKVVLQMPRGHLEAVSHRVLVTALIEAALLEHDYATAWQCASVNRVDLALLVAFAWPDFLGRAAKLVRDVPNDQDLADVLASLQPHEGTGGLLAALSSTQGGEGEISQAVKDGAVAAACGAMRQAMRDAGPDCYLRPLLTSHLLVGELTTALAIIKERKEAQLSASASGQEAEDGHGATSAEAGLKHVLLTVDVQVLYKAALSMYDLELAYMVVAHSQLDPGEYLLELQQFAKHGSVALRQHAIDMHLRRYSHAMRDLLQAGDEHFAAAVQLAEGQGLLLELLSLVPEEETQKRALVLTALGGSLRERGLHEDAAVAFMAAGDDTQALLQYQAAGQWQMAFALAGRLEYDEEAVQELADDLVEDLASMGRLRDASTIVQQYLQDTARAVSLLTQAREWREAARVAWQVCQGGLVTSAIAPAATEAADAMMQEMHDDVDRIHKYLERLKEVRSKRLAMAAMLADKAEEREQEADGFDELEVASKVSTAVTGMSAYARTDDATSIASTSGRPASTVGGRKPARKPRKGKRGSRIRQGTPQEENALAGHLLRLAPPSQRTSETGQLTELLIYLGRPGLAAALQQAMSTLIKQQSAAAAWIAANPPPPEPASKTQQGQRNDRGADQGEDWKWAILRAYQAPTQDSVT